VLRASLTKETRKLRELRPRRQAPTVLFEPSEAGALHPATFRSSCACRRVGAGIIKNWLLKQGTSDFFKDNRGVVLVFHPAPIEQENQVTTVSPICNLQRDVWFPSIG